MRAIHLTKLRADEKVAIAHDGFQSRFPQPRDRGEILRARRAIDLQRNFLFNPREYRKFFPRACPHREISLSRSLGRTLSNYTNQSLTTGSSAAAREMAKKRVYIALVLDQFFKINRTDRNPDKLIVRRVGRSNC